MFDRRLAILLAAGITIGCLVLLIPRDGLIAVLATVAQADPLAVAGAVAAQTLANLARAWRLAVVVTPGRRLDRTVLRVSTLHVLLSQVMPMRTGEVSLVILLRRAYGESILAASGILIGLRLIELCLVCAIGGLAIGGVASGPALTDLRGVFLLGGVACLGGFLALPWLIGAGRRLGDWLDARGLGRPAGYWRQILEGFCRQPPSALLMLQGTTLATWLGILAAAWLCAAAVAAGMDLATVSASIAAGSIAFALPANGIGQIGPFEAAFVFAAELAGGIARAPALAAAVLFHGVGLSTAVCLAFLAWVIQYTERTKH